MKVAITGGSGFLGRHVLRELQQRDVDIIDARRNPVGELNFHARTQVVKLDLADAQGAFSAMGNPDLLIHLAWEGLPAYRSERHVDVELPAQIRFLLACEEEGLKRLTVAGTCFEYGMQEGILDERTEAMPSTQYGIAKHRLHGFLESLADRGRIELDWARFFYLFGPGQAPSSLYAQLMSAIDQRRTSFDMSGGAQIRDFLPVSEAARLFVDVALAPRGAGTINICSGVPVTVGELVNRWVASRGAVIELNKGHYPYPDFEPMAFWGSRAKLNALLQTL